MYRYTLNIINIEYFVADLIIKIIESKKKDESICN